MKKRLFIFLSVVIMLFITIMFTTLKVNAGEGDEELPNEEETTTEVNENEVTEDSKNYAELRESIADILDSIDELKKGNVNWFEDELINHLITLALSVVGTIIVILIYFKKTKLINTDITSLITNGKKTDDDLAKDFATNIEFVKKQAEELGIKQEQIEKVENSVKNLMDNFNNKVVQLENQLKEQNIKNTELLEIVKIAFLNNPELVKTGYASKIEGIINKYEQRN